MGFRVTSEEAKSVSSALLIGIVSSLSESSRSSSEAVSWLPISSCWTGSPKSQYSNRVLPQEANVENACVRLRLVPISFAKKFSNRDTKDLINGSSNLMRCGRTRLECSLMLNESAPVASGSARSRAEQQ